VAVLGLQQPTNHQQHAHQVIERQLGSPALKLLDWPWMPILIVVVAVLGLFAVVQ
jgi:hypothetical protein